MNYGLVAFYSVLKLARDDFPKLKQETLFCFLFSTYGDITHLQVIRNATITVVKRGKRSLPYSERNMQVGHSQEESTSATTISLTPKQRVRRWRQIGIAAILATLLLGVVGELGWWKATATSTTLPGSTFNQGKNATWIAHTWVGDNHTPQEYQQLFQRLQHEQITSIYAHVGPLEHDGSIPLTRYPYAAKFATLLHQYSASFKLYAWMGQIYQIGATANDDDLDISQPAVRQLIANTAGIFTNTLAFDGIHFDIEPIPNNDNHFLDLLDETRTVIGKNHLISIATPNWIPIARVADVMEAVTNRTNVWWTTYYYLAVSQHVDQIVVMLYNTDMATAPLYQALVQQETAHVLRAVQRGSYQTHVIIGIPTFKGSSRAFHDSAENMHTGLNGIISGLNYSTFHSAFQGVAVYPEWLTTNDDWSTYDRMWLGLTGS